MKKNCVYHDDKMVQLVTYGPYIPEKKVHYERVFSVPKDWLKQYLNKEDISLDQFLEKCTLDETLNTYVYAANAGVLMEAVVV